MCLDLSHRQQRTTPEPELPASSKFCRIPPYFSYLGGTVASLFLGIVQPQVYPFCFPPLQLEALLYFQAVGMLTLKSRNQGQCPCWLVDGALLFCCLPCRMIKLTLREEKWTKPLNWPRFERDFFIAIRESHRHGDRMKSITVCKKKKIVEMGLFTLKKRLKMNHELSLNKLMFSTSASESKKKTYRVWRI